MVKKRNYSYATRKWWYLNYLSHRDDPEWKLKRKSYHDNYYNELKEINKTCKFNLENRDDVINLILKLRSYEK